MRWTTGREYVQASAWHGNNDHPDYPGFQDQAGVLFKLDNGGTAMTNLDYLRPEPAPTHGDDRLRIAGSEGVLEVLGAGTDVNLITAADDPGTGTRRACRLRRHSWQNLPEKANTSSAKRTRSD